MFPRLLKTISSSLARTNWSRIDLLHAEAFGNQGKQVGLHGFSPSRAAVQKGSDRPTET